ncbi:hypothetical protein, partial [Staphylococcus aureus]|uniref:hypothetical protein n=1 Tax=Staphylococcus aureus TaxID=1280 RepID=UPI0038B34F4B
HDFCILSCKSRGDIWPKNGATSTAAPRDLSDLRRAAVLFVGMVLEFFALLHENDRTTTGRFIGLPAELSPTAALGLWHRVSMAQVTAYAPDL